MQTSFFPPIPLGLPPIPPHPSVLPSQPQYPQSSVSMLPIGYSAFGSHYPHPKEWNNRNQIVPTQHPAQYNPNTHTRSNHSGMYPPLQKSFSLKVTPTYLSYSHSKSNSKSNSNSQSNLFRNTNPTNVKPTNKKKEKKNPCNQDT